MRNMLEEFKKFALRGNVIDLAVGVIIGAAFGKITSSLVENIMTPLLSLLTGGVDFSNRLVTLRPEIVDGAGTVVRDAVVMNYGLFIQSMIDFIIIAFAVFLFIKAINSLQRKEGAKENSAVKPQQVLLLEEIRDLLRSGK